MGKRSTTANEEALDVLSGTLTAVGASASKPLHHDFNVSLWGTFAATVQVERSFDGGTTFVPVSKDASGTTAAFTAPCSIICDEPELGVLYRLNCTAYTSGTVNFRLSR
jgi:hypothetical protein